MARIRQNRFQFDQVSVSGDDLAPSLNCSFTETLTWCVAGLRGLDGRRSRHYPHHGDAEAAGDGGHGEQPGPAGGADARRAAGGAAAAAHGPGGERGGGGGARGRGAAPDAPDGPSRPDPGARPKKRFTLRSSGYGERLHSIPLRSVPCPTLTECASLL